MTQNQSWLIAAKSSVLLRLDRITKLAYEDSGMNNQDDNSNTSTEFQAEIRSATHRLYT